jgi:hypothetical protein
VKEGPYVLIACNAASAIGRIGAGSESPVACVLEHR